MTHITAFAGHRGAITGLGFRHGTGQLFSCSEDRTVKVWSLDDMAYVDTLFGHQDRCIGLDTQRRERLVTVGADQIDEILEGARRFSTGASSAGGRRAG